MDLIFDDQDVSFHEHHQQRDYSRFVQILMKVVDVTSDGENPVIHPSINVSVDFSIKRENHLSKNMMMM